MLLPGYGASAAVYYRLIKDLSAEFEVHCVDFRGMGWFVRPSVYVRVVVPGGRCSPPEVGLRPSTTCSRG